MCLIVFFVFFLIKIEKNTFFRSVATYHVPEIMLIYSSKNTTSGITVALLATTLWSSY